MTTQSTDPASSSSTAPPPSGPPGQEKQAGPAVAPYRELAATVLVGANAAWLVLAIIRLFVVFIEDSSFSSRADGLFDIFVGFISIFFPLTAVLLATFIRPPVARGKLIAGAALAEYAVSALFGLVCLFAAFIQTVGADQAGAIVEAFLTLLARLVWLVVLGFAAFLVSRVFQNLYYVARPKATPTAVGYPQGYPPPGRPGQPGYQQGYANPAYQAAYGPTGGYPTVQGYPQQGYPGQPGYPPQTYQQPGYPQGYAQQPGQPQPGQPQAGYQHAGYPQAGYPPAGYPQPGYQQPGYPPAGASPAAPPPGPVGSPSATGSPAATGSPVSGPPSGPPPSGEANPPSDSSPTTVMPGPYPPGPAGAPQPPPDNDQGDKTQLIPPADPPTAPGSQAGRDAPPAAGSDGGDDQPTRPWS